MAAVAVRGHGGVVTQRTILVTFVAGDGGVRSNQREAPVVLLDLCRLNLPATHRVALLAVRTQLPAVNIGVALRAQMTHVGEDRLGVARGAGHALVQAAQWKACRIVIKFWDGADWLPAIERMTVLTGDVQRTVRTARRQRGLRLGLGRLLRSRQPRQQYHHK